MAGIRFSIERGHISGPVEYTDAIFQINPIRFVKNEPTTFEIAIAKTDKVTGWFDPTRGDYVRVEDMRWQARFNGVPPGMIFTGYINSTPRYELLGSRNGEEVWGYHLRCTSDDYLMNSKRMPVRTFINKTRGFILRALLEEMFADYAVQFPFDLTQIHDGGIERIFQVDPSKYFTELAAEFAKSDGYVFMAIDSRVLYVPELAQPIQGNYADVLVISKDDPRYSPRTLDVQRLDVSIVNDLTVVGLDEPTTVCSEQFVSDGYQPNHDLTYVPYGLDESQVLSDDFTTDTVNEATWEEKDPSDFITPFQGSLNITGGPGADTGTCFLRSLKGIELVGVINTRDGELSFPPAATGTGYIGGLYTEDDCLEAHLWCGWYLDLVTNKLTPRGPDGPHENSVTINPTFSYVLRRTITVDRSTPQPSTVLDVATGLQYDEPFDPGAARVTWEVEEIDISDPTNVESNKYNLGTYEYENPEFVLYGAVVPYSCHVVINNIAVTRPQQIVVEVDVDPDEDGGEADRFDQSRDLDSPPDTPTWFFQRHSLRVGPYIDGGQCAVDLLKDRARLAWYAVKVPSRGLAGVTPASTTIPSAGTVVNVRYSRSDISKIRIRSISSIKAERAKFKDDGVRQLTLTPNDVTPPPRTSEECLFVGRAYLSDRVRPRYEGSYEFVTSEIDQTNLSTLVYPGDKILCDITTPEGRIYEALSVTSVDVVPVSPVTYVLKVAFGPINRFDNAQRELLRRRHSSLQSISIAKSDAVDADVMDKEGYDPVPDPVPPVVDTLDDTTLTVTFGASVGADVTGYECRLIDGGWGLGGHVARFNGHQVVLPRDRREVRYFFRSYRVNPNGTLSFSRRSAMIRNIFPMKNQISIGAITGQYNLNINAYQVAITLPNDPDFSHVRVRDGNNIVIYEGDGILNIVKADYVEPLLTPGKLNLTISTLQYPYTVKAQAINLVGQQGAAETLATMFRTYDESIAMTVKPRSPVS
jgi:hypothetical protein